jgi:hypothetical protein
MFEDKLGVSLTKVLGIAAVAPKSDGVAKLLGRMPCSTRRTPSAGKTPVDFFSRGFY